MRGIPGMTDVHCVMTPQCRKRPKKEVKKEVLDKVEESLDQLLEVWPRSGKLRFGRV